MKDTFKFGFILGIICVVAAGLLAGANYLTKPKILAQALAEENAGLKAVLPGTDKFEAVKDQEEVLYYKGYDSNGKLVGFAFKAIGKGYSSLVETLVGMLKDGRITAIKILSQNETPGLGSRITEANFTGRFKGVSSLKGVEAITGATISSKAVISSVEKKALEVRSLINNEN